MQDTKADCPIDQAMPQVEGIDETKRNLAEPEVTDIIVGVFAGIDQGHPINNSMAGAI